MMAPPFWLCLSKLEILLIDAGGKWQTIERQDDVAAITGHGV